MSTETTGISESKISQSESAKINFLPCSIDYDGPAAVSTFFIVKEKENLLESHFRGRLLVGKEYEVPQHLFAVHAVVSKSDDQKTTNLSVVSEVKKLNMWQHNRPPAINELDECMDWIDIADEVCT